MTQTASQPLQSQLLHGVTWDEYTRTLLKRDAEGSHAHVTYDHGEMEIMTHGDNHERAKKALARLIETYALEADIPVLGLGEVTCRREDLLKGLDPDECYYVNTPPPPPVEGSAPLDLSKYPPPDLAIGVEISQSSIPKQPIYAAIGVGELWRYDGTQLRPFRLNATGKYEPISRSIAFPALPLEQMYYFLQMALTGSQHAAAKAIRDWERDRKK